MKILNAKLPNGQYLIPSAHTNPNSRRFGYDASPRAPMRSPRRPGNREHRLCGERQRSAVCEYYVQNDPTTNHLARSARCWVFPATLGRQPRGIGQQHCDSYPQSDLGTAGWFHAPAGLHGETQPFNPSTLESSFGSTAFPQFDITTEIPPSATVAVRSWHQLRQRRHVSEPMGIRHHIQLGKGRHTLLGILWDHTQLNIVNHNTDTDNLEFTTFLNFVEGSVRSGCFHRPANRYYRSDTAGAFVNDNYKMRSNLTVTLGLRWDRDGPLSEKYGRLTDFNASQYSYNAATDTITGSGLEIAGKTQFGTQGASNPHEENTSGDLRRASESPGTSETDHPRRIGIYYDRGEFFS